MGKIANKQPNGILKIIICTLLLFAIESISYFVVAEYFGALTGKEHTFNLQLPLDRIVPWFTPLFAIYIPWPFMWFFVLPIIIYKAAGTIGFCRYTVNSFLMYIIGTVIYAVFPTTTVPADFINGTFMTLSENAPFHDTLVNLAADPHNIWGSFPSYHNYWASLLIIFGLTPRAKLLFKIPMAIVGALISVSTLTLHQHCVLDVLFTYAMTGVFLLITVKFGLDKKLQRWFG